MQQYTKPKTEYTQYSNCSTTFTTGATKKIISDLLNKFNFIPEIKNTDSNKVKYISIKQIKNMKLINGSKRSELIISVKLTWLNNTFIYINYKK